MKRKREKLSLTGSVFLLAIIASIHFTEAPQGFSRVLSPSLFEFSLSFFSVFTAFFVGRYYQEVLQ